MPPEELIDNSLETQKEEINKQFLAWQAETKNQIERVFSKKFSNEELLAFIRDSKFIRRKDNTQINLNEIPTVLSELTNNTIGDANSRYEHQEMHRKYAEINGAGFKTTWIEQNLTPSQACIFNLTLSNVANMIKAPMAVKITDYFDNIDLLEFYNEKQHLYDKYRNHEIKRSIEDYVNRIQELNKLITTYEREGEKTQEFINAIQHAKTISKAPNTPTAEIDHASALLRYHGAIKHLSDYIVSNQNVKDTKTQRIDTELLSAIKGMKTTFDVEISQGKPPSTPLEDIVKIVELANKVLDPNLNSTTRTFHAEQLVAHCNQLLNSPGQERSRNLKKILGIGLAILGTLLIAASITALVFSAGAATPLSVLGVTLGTKAIIAGAATAATVGLATVTYGSLLTKKGFYAQTSAEGMKAASQDLLAEVRNDFKCT